MIHKKNQEEPGVVGFLFLLLFLFWGRRGEYLQDVVGGFVTLS